MTSYCQYTPDKKEQSTQNQTKICAIIVFYVYFVLYIELLFGDVGLNGSLNGKVTAKYYVANKDGMSIEFDSIGFGTIIVNNENNFGLYIYNKPYLIHMHTVVDFPWISFEIKSDSIVMKNIPKYTSIKLLQ